MIKEYEEAAGTMDAPRQYALNQTHKHLKEMKAITGIEREPFFLPVVAAFPRGMQVSVPLSPDYLKCGMKGLKEVYGDIYNGEVIKYEDITDSVLPADLLKGKDGMIISVIGNENRPVAVATFDNLGKGASGAAIQNMNIMLGMDEKIGLIL